MRQAKRVTIKDVAEEAGVSAQTVSRVINDRPDVSDATRAHVQNVINQMGYSPNVLARSLIQGRSNTLGVVGYGLEYFGSAGVLTGIERKTNEFGFSLLFSLLDQFQPTRVGRILNELLSRQVEGIIWAVPGHVPTFDWLTEEFERINIPVVFLNKEQTNDHVIVAMDNQLGGRLATEHLLDQGYRRIGIITGPADWWEAQERELGWRAALQEAGLKDLEPLKVVGDWSAASGEVGLHTLHAKAPDLDAVFASNDQMALGALQAARRIGLRVPQDLGIVGFDDIPEAAFFSPPLTTVRQNLKALGALAVEQMKSHIAARRSDEEFTPGISWVQPSLIIRKSSLQLTEANGAKTRK